MTPCSAIQVQHLVSITCTNSSCLQRVRRALHNNESAEIDSVAEETGSRVVRWDQPCLPLILPQLPLNDSHRHRGHEAQPNLSCVGTTPWSDALMVLDSMTPQACASSSALTLTVTSPLKRVSVQSAGCGWWIFIRCSPVLPTSIGEQHIVFHL